MKRGCNETRHAWRRVDTGIIAGADRVWLQWIQMSLTSQSELQGQCLKIVVAGRYASRAEVFQVMDQLKAEADRAACQLAILDLTAAEGPTTDMDRYFLGEHAALVFGAQLKVAVVFPAEGITKFGENVAVNRGARLTVVPTEHDALKWLGLVPDDGAG
jgi:hypothetical protein